MTDELPGLWSFHLLETTASRGVRLLLGGLGSASGRGRPRPPGQRVAETMTLMELGAPIVSPRRVQARRLALFAAWDSPEHLRAFLGDDAVGRQWAQGWHVELEYLRRWGHVEAFGDLPVRGAPHDDAEPVVAVTLARVKFPQIPRFVRWGRPVEAQVRDDPGQTLALAAARPPITVSTFTVWRSAQAMQDMVAGRSTSPGHTRHAAAMHERDRKDFHHEFTTLRFRCLAEHGSWQGRTGIVPSGGDGAR